MAQVRSALIVGAGVAGLAAAAALDRRGIACELVEQNPDWRALGAGLLIQANGVRALRSLGLAAGLAAAGTPVHQWIFADDQGAELCAIDLQHLWGGVGPCLGVARARLQSVLLEGARGVPYRLSTSVTSLTEHDDGVDVTFTDGSSGTFDVVIGADGLRSAVRGLAFGLNAAVFGGQLAWRSVARIRLPGPPSVQFWLGDSTFFGLCWVGDGYTYGFANERHAQRHRDPVQGRLARMRRRFADYGSAVQDYLSALEHDEQIHCSTIEWIEQEQWRTGRTVLIGDAAHASSPMMGRGGCLAIEDAVVLAEELHTAPTVEDGLARYDERRRARVEWVKAQSRGVADSLGLAPALRNGILRERGAEMFAQRFGPLLAAT